MRNVVKQGAWCKSARPVLGVVVASLLALLGVTCAKARKAGDLPEPGAAATGGAGPVPAPAATAPIDDEKVAEQELAEQVERVRGTGPATPEIEKSFASTLSQLKTRLQSSTHAQFLDNGCFRGGCTFTMQFPKQVPHESVDTALLQDEAFARWPGGKFRSGVFSSDEKTAKVTWILFLDDAATPAGRLPTDH